MKEKNILFIISFSLITSWYLVNGQNCSPLETMENGRVVLINALVRKYMCNKGFTLSIKSSRYIRCGHDGWTPAQPAKCIDKNECTSGIAKYPCDKHADCENTMGSYKCVCRSGYYGDGHKCWPRINKLDEYLKKNNHCGIVSMLGNKTRTRFRRIVGGRKTLPGDWPWQALITVTGGMIPLLSGVLVRPGWVLTTANPLIGRNGKVQGNQIIVSLGEYDRNRPENEEQQFRVKNIFIHPKFDNRKNLNNDIAILQLDGKAEMTDHVNTICIASARTVRKFEKNYNIATVSGWGIAKSLSLLEQINNRRATTMFSGVLQHVKIPLMPSYRCASATSYYYRRKTMLCAYNNYRIEKAPCLGDNGAPLTIEDPNTKRWVLLGLYSWSEGCGQPDRYSYYTRVSRYEHWINKVTTDEGLHN